ncbi:MAG: threonine--tRNA ligase [Candidatus Hodarchaeales archaeon]|jgi:threonyl-tRNA synthetase
MQLLLIHSHGFEWKVTEKAIKDAESSKDVSLNYKTSDSVLITFISVEEPDISDMDHIIEQTGMEIQAALKDVGEKQLILYPWVHLAKTTPANPNTALSTIKKLEKYLRTNFEDLDIIRAPFGYYKGFTLNCKGHALAERSKEITGRIDSKPLEKTAEVTEALTAEEAARSIFYILNEKGEKVPFEDFKFKGNMDLESFVKYETAKDRTVSSAPKHVDIMKKLELVDYEKGSDPGNFRILPRGFIVKRLIEDHVNNMAIDYGAMIVETPLMYSYEHPSLKKYLERFPARQYVIQSGNKNYFLRFAACFGQFLAMSDAIISYRQLPLKIFEMAKSFRREQRGELAGIRRLRAFTMPDLHTAATAAEYMKDIEVIYETAFRMTSKFYEENQDWILSLVKQLKKPILLELFDTRYAYFILKFEFNVVDEQKKAAALSTVQIDVENSERFNITYVNSDGEEVYPLLMHCSLSGSTERVIYGIIEDQLKRSLKGKKPQFPLWLSPAQVRILPISEENVKYSKTVANELEKANIRVEIDDRDISLGKKIRAAEKLWTPIILVLGEKEEAEKKVNARYRFNNAQEYQTVEEIVKYIKSNVKGKPTFFRAFPMCVSEQPIFSRIV